MLISIVLFTVELPKYEGPQGVFVSIGGNIGSGKSTLSKLMAREWEFRPYYESVDDNPFMGFL
jgi:deoxyadenosine/deoxycytidine kinase